MTGGSQEEVTVHVTVVDPPQAGGGPLLSSEMVTLHPPETETSVSQFAKLLLMLAWVKQAGLVRLGGHVRATAGASATVNTAEQVTSGSQDDATVQVTVVDPPQAGGAAPALLVIVALQPPE